jgi:pimeloyl-ACP methyl ester carboxylesterase
MKTVLSLLLASFALSSIQAQELARRSFLGIEAVKKDSRLMVLSVAPNSTASAAGIVSGDELLAINSESLSDPAQLPELQREFRAGSRLQLSIKRAGMILTKAATALPLPLQSNPEFDTMYKTVNIDGSLYRAIITKPKNSGRFPAVFLIGGLGCYSLDPMRENSPYSHILYSLTRDGFVTMRVDKSGEGDSEGPGCKSDAATLQLAAQRSIAGLEALRGYDFIDPSHIFVFAHSLGPMEGALVVGRVPIRGFIAAETIGKSWFDYQVEIARSQPLLLGQSYFEVEAFTRTNLQCLSLFYLQGLSEADVVKAQPNCEDDLPSQAGMPAAYFRDIAKVNLAEEWKRVDIPVLVTYGNSDPLTSQDESRYLVAMINNTHPSRATYLEFDHMSHHFDRQPDQAQALRALSNGTNGTYDITFVSRIEQWMRSI